MLRLGFVQILAILVFGIAAPYGLFRLSRAVGLWPLLVAALALGLGYGVLKVDNPWNGPGLTNNLLLMGASAAALVAYVAVSVGVARAIAKIKI